MTDALVEKVMIALREVPDIMIEGQYYTDWVGEARAAILAVLDHFSELGNVTDDMAAEMLIVMDAMRPAKAAIAAAMRAARKEFEDAV